jgi:ferritin
MLTSKIETAINKQLNNEYYSGYLYLAMAAWFDSINLEGFSHWMRLQAQEELDHAMKLYDHILERDAKVTLSAIEAPPTEWKAPLDACQDALKAERVNTKQINDLVEEAAGSNDHATRVFLQWFISEQVEEEATATRLVEKVKLVGDDKGALFILDSEMGKRQLAAGDSAP